jgi:hypothetical protein
MGATVAAAAMMRKEREVLAHFRQARATSPDTAKTLTELQLDEGLAFRRLRARAVVRESSPGAFYLDEASYEALQGVRRRMLMVVFLIVLAMAIAMFFATRTVS